MHFMKTNSHSDINKHCALLSSSCWVFICQISCLRYVSSIPDLSVSHCCYSHPLLLLEVHVCCCRCSLQLCSSVLVHFAQQVLLTMPWAQAGDKEWDTMASSCSPANSDMARGDSTVWLSFGSSVFNCTPQKDTALHICIKWQCTAFYQRSGIAARHQTRFRDWDTREGGQAHVMWK